MRQGTFLGASVVAAIVASFCCILPIVFALGGFAVIGAAGFFEGLRPYLLAVTFAMLGAGFYFAYRKPREVCAPGEACAAPAVGRYGRLGLWTATAFVALFATFPYYSGPVAELLLRAGEPEQQARANAGAAAEVTFAVEGMDCPACAATIQKRLSRLAGVRAVEVSYEEQRARVEFDPSQVKPEELERAIADAGFRPRRM